MDKKASLEIRLSTEERRQLEELISKGSSPYRAKTRARILLMAAEFDESNSDSTLSRTRVNRSIAYALQVTAQTVRIIREHYLDGGLEATLYDKPIPGRPVKNNEEVERKLTMLASSAPPTGHKRWTLQLLADRMIEQGYVDHMSDTWVSEILIKTKSDFRPSKGYRPSKEETESKLIMLARSEPPAGYERWTQKLLADRMVELGYVNHMSVTWVRKTLKKANCDY